MKIVTSADMREIDRVTSENFGVPALTLMENAGSEVAEFALSSYPGTRTFGVICGKGNNGGDGFVIARKLHSAGREVRVLLLAEPKNLGGDAAANYEKLPIKPTFARSAEELESDEAGRVFHSEVLVDAILGSGFRPPVSALYAAAIEKINGGSAPVIAVDVPSGVEADLAAGQSGTIARANAVVTFTAPRPAHVLRYLASGPTVIAPIGSPVEAIRSSLNLNLITAKDVAPLFGPRPRDSNKGMYGHVLVVGGSIGKAGAAAMAGFSAYRAGAGLVTVATAQSVLPTVAGFHPELMTEPLEETEEGTIAAKAGGHIAQLSENKTVLAIGPGISRNPETAEMVRQLVHDSAVPIVLDADGLNAFAGRTQDLKRDGRSQEAAERGALILTPHPGEMARLTGLNTKQVQQDRLGLARSFAREHAVILVLKGDRTIIARPDGEAWVNPTGNPGMATGGTGDILTGIVAGMVAQHPHRIFEAVLAGVYLHGLAGDLACESLGELPLVATDLVRTLPDAFRRVRAQAAENRVKIG